VTAADGQNLPVKATHTTGSSAAGTVNHDAVSMGFERPVSSHIAAARSDCPNAKVILLLRK
jgi:hypothetical protein